MSAPGIAVTHSWSPVGARRGSPCDEASDRGVCVRPWRGVRMGRPQCIGDGGEQGAHSEEILRKGQCRNLCHGHWGQRESNPWEEVGEARKVRVVVFEREWEARLLAQAGTRSQRALQAWPRVTVLSFLE